jgi:hypothetical protein
MMRHVRARGSRLARRNFDSAPTNEARNSAPHQLIFWRWVSSAVVSLLLLFFLIHTPRREPVDFRAFYCAGAAVAERANPYLVEPDSSCQGRVLAESGARLGDTIVLPAPLPPYALIAFGALSRLPYRSAAELWLLASTLALALSIVFVAQLSNAPALLVGLSLVVSVGYQSIVLGQLVPIVLAATLFAALCSRFGNGGGAAIGAAIAALEPNLAVPVWLGLGIFVPITRKPLIIAAAILLALTLIAGAALNLEYVLSVLPLHARSELRWFGGQYSLSSLLVALGVPFHNAMLAGSASYGIMTVLGLATGVALSRRFSDAAFVVTAPAASVVLGGPFLHLTQIAVAIPLGFMLLAPRRPPPALFGALALALCFLAIPWTMVGSASPSGTRTQVALESPTRHVAPHTTPGESIEIPYTAFVDAAAQGPNHVSLGDGVARKAPTWFALIDLLACALWLAFTPTTQQSASELHRPAMNGRFREQDRLI